MRFPLRLRSAGFVVERNEPQPFAHDEPQFIARLADPARPQIELDYIERLLKDY